MRTWVNKSCCAIWRDHCRHDAKRRVRDCRQPRRIPELPYLLEQSRQIAAAYAGKSVYMITARAIGFALYWPCDLDHPVIARLQGCSLAFWRRAERISNAVAGADLLHGESPMLPIRLSVTCTPIMVGRNFYRTPRFQPISLGIHCIKSGTGVEPVPSS